MGTAAAPLGTIQVAVRRLAAGGHVELRGGVYHQRVRLVGVHGVTISRYRHEHPILSGSGLTPPIGLTALVEIADSSAVTVRGLDVTGYRTDKLDVTPAGVYVHGHDTSIRIVGNHVHDLGNDNDTLGSFDINAHGIAIYGDDPHAPITDLSIRGNVVNNLHLGASESVVVNGNVDGWTIAGNRIHDNNNIGIDAIGFEPTLSEHNYHREPKRRPPLECGRSDLAGGTDSVGASMGSGWPDPLSRRDDSQLARRPTINSRSQTRDPPATPINAPARNRWR